MPKPKLIDEPDHHFVKHFKKRELIRENGVVVGVHPAALYLRPKDSTHPEEKWLSGQYYEFYDGTHLEKLCACCHFIPLEMKRNDALCRMKIGEIKDVGGKRGKSLRVYHQGETNSPGYAALHGLPKASDPIDDELLALLATLAALDTVEVHQIL